MSIEVPIDQLFVDLHQWGAGFLTTVGADQRPRFVALRPGVVDAAGGRALAFERAGRTAAANVVERSAVSIVFPPHQGSEGYSLIVDGVASVDPADDVTIHVVPTWAVKHRPAP